MYFSKRSEHAEVVFRSADQPLALALLDDLGQVVLRGYGTLSGAVPVGLYWLRIRSGAEVVKRIVRVGPEGVQEVVKLRQQIAAPLPGSRDDAPEQREAVQRLSNACSAALKPGEAGVVLFLRGEIAEQSVGLWGPDESEEHLSWERAEGYSAGWATLPPGGGWLRTLRGSPTDMALWTSSDRVHIWFAMVSNGQVNYAGSSWHTHRPGASWLLDEEHPEIRMHAEQALAALRLSDTAVSEAIVDTLRQYKMWDPMLGILAGALRVKRAADLLRVDPDGATRALLDVDFMVERMADVDPKLPDVVALRHITASLREQLGGGTGRSSWGGEPVAFPPMLATLATTLEGMDHPPGRTLELGSLAAQVACRRTAQGPWTAWAALDAYVDDTQSMVAELADRLRNAKSKVPRESEGMPESAGAFDDAPMAAAMPDASEEATADAFDQGSTRALIEADELDDAAVDAFIAWAEANPQAYQALGQQVLADDGVVEKAAPTPIDPDAHARTIQAVMDREGVSGPMFAPASLKGIQAALADAHASGRRLRAVGSFRSLSDVRLPTNHDHFIVALSRLDGVEALPAHDEVYVQAGCRIGNLNIALDEVGLALPNMGSGDFQTVAGLLSTGSHGSAYGIGDFSALVLAIELATVDAAGQPVLLRLMRPGATVHHPGYQGRALPVQTLNDDHDAFNAAIVSLGCLGIITAVTLRVEKAFFLREDRVRSTWAQLHLLTAARLPRHFEVLFTPYANEDQPLLVTSRVVTDGANQVVRAVGLELAARDIGRKTARKRLDAALRDPAKVAEQIRQSVGCTEVSNYRRKSFRVLKLGLQIDATAVEVAVPISSAMAAAQDLSALVQARMARWQPGGDPVAFWRDHAVPTSPISMRLAARSTGLLSMQHAPSGELDGEPWCMFEVPILRDATRTDADYTAYVEGTDGLLAAIEAKLREGYGGRPHWGLQFTATEAQIGQLWGDAWTRWKAVRARLNPHGIFDSRFTDRMGLS